MPALRLHTIHNQTKLPIQVVCLAVHSRQALRAVGQMASALATQVSLVIRIQVARRVGRIPTNTTTNAWGALRIRPLRRRVCPQTLVRARPGIMHRPWKATSPKELQDSSVGRARTSHHLPRAVRRRRVALATQATTGQRDPGVCAWRAGPTHTPRTRARRGLRRALRALHFRRLWRRVWMLRIVRARPGILVQRGRATTAPPVQ